MTKKEQLLSDISKIEKGLNSDLEENFKIALREALTEKKKQLAELKDEKPAEKKVSAPAPAKKEEGAKKSPKDVLENCREILRKHNKEKASAKSRIEKRKKQGKPAELTPSETVSKTAKSVKAKVVDMKEKGLSASEVDKLANGIVATIKSTLAGIKETSEKHSFLNQIKKEISYLDGHLSKVAEYGGMFAQGGEIDENGLIYALQNHISSGFIANHTKYDNYNDIDALRGTALEILYKNGDMPYSVENLVKIIKQAEALREQRGYADGGMFADGGTIEDKLKKLYAEKDKLQDELKKDGKRGDMSDSKKEIGIKISNINREISELLRQKHGGSSQFGFADGGIIKSDIEKYITSKYYIDFRDFSINKENGKWVVYPNNIEQWESEYGGKILSIIENDINKKYEVGGALDGLMGDINAPVQNVGGTLFSTADLTSHLDFNANPMFKDGGNTNYTKKWKVVGIDMYGKKFEKVITLGRMSNESDVKMQLRRMNLPIREVTMIKEYSEDGGYMAKGGEISDIENYKKILIEKAKSKGVYENFGQKEVMQLENKYGYTQNVANFDNWVMNFDKSKYSEGGLADYYEKKKYKYEEGGLTDENTEMLMSQIKEIKHHAEEIENLINNNTSVEAWVVAKAERSATDLSDITHYIDGKKETFAEGGEIKWQDVNIGDSANVKAENKTGVIVHTYGRKFNVKFVDGSEKTYDASELEFFKDDEDMFADGGLVGKRVRLIQMYDDPNPIESGTMGTISNVGGGIINVNWDNGRYLGLAEGVDEYEILDENSYADGGTLDEAKISNITKNIMGTISFNLQLKGMRKPQDFTVYPISSEDSQKPILIQSDTRFGMLDLNKGIGIMSQSHPNGAYSYHLQMDKNVRFSLSKDNLDLLRSKIRETAGSKVGDNGVVFSDNSGASMFSYGGGVREGLHLGDILEFDGKKYQSVLGVKGWVNFKDLSTKKLITPINSLWDAIYNEGAIVKKFSNTFAEGGETSEFPIVSIYMDYGDKGASKLYNYLKKEQGIDVDNNKDYRKDKGTAQEFMSGEYFIIRFNKKDLRDVKSFENKFDNYFFPKLEMQYHYHKENPNFEHGGDTDDSKKKELKEILSKDYETFVELLGENIKDPKFRHTVIELAKEKKIKHKLIDVECEKLRPTQNEISVSKSLLFPLTSTHYADMYLKAEHPIKIKNATILTCDNGEYIIDGHHRWSQVFVLNPKAKMSCTDFYELKKPFAGLKATQLGISADLGYVPTQDVKDTNLLKISEQELKKYVTDNITDEVREVFKKNGINNPEEHIWKNVVLLKSKNKPVKNAPKRDLMPQTDLAEHFEDYTPNVSKLKKGGMTTPTFDDKVKAISERLLKYKKVSPKVQKDYGKEYSKKEAIESAKRIAGAMRKNEMSKKKN